MVKIINPLAFVQKKKKKEDSRCSHSRLTKKAHIRKCQQAYSKSKSMETALHSLMSIIKIYKLQTVYNTKYLDIEGAFNNIETAAFQSSLMSHNLLNFVTITLRKRVNHSELNNFSITGYKRNITRWNFSSLFWNITINPFLQKS